MHTDAEGSGVRLALDCAVDVPRVLMENWRVWALESVWMSDHCVLRWLESQDWSSPERWRGISHCWPAGNT